MVLETVLFEATQLNKPANRVISLKFHGVFSGRAISSAKGDMILAKSRK